MSPRGIPGIKSKCYRLNKALYGLKQAHLAWHTRLCCDLQQLGYEELPSAPCVFRRGSTPKYSFLLVYVDDIVLMCPTPEELKLAVEKLNAFYELRVCKDVNLFLGVQLTWHPDADGYANSLKMSQSLYVQSVLRRFGMSECKPATTPMVQSFFSGVDTEENKVPVDVERYQQMVGSLLYLALRTRPDILAPVLILARFQSMPTAYCHQGVKRVLRYLQGTYTHGLIYRAASTAISGYVDADYAGDSIDRKSMSGYMIKLDKALCVWGAKKQSAVALSTCEAEYHAMTLAAAELLWIRRVMMEAGIFVANGTPLRSDNQSAISWAIGERSPSGRAKHVDVRIHFVRDLVRNKVIQIEYVATEQNDADVLTKPVGRDTLESTLKRVRLGGTIAEEC